MKICAACNQELPKEGFSKKQWKLKQHERRCIDCISANRLVTKPREDAIYDDAPSCWICLGEGPDELGNPLIRDCSCRGSDAGFAHRACIVQYATMKFEDSEGNLNWEVWEICPGCMQSYQKTLAADLANDCVSFVEKQYDSHDKLVCIEALHQKHVTFADMFNYLSPEKKRDGQQTAHKVIAEIEHLKHSKETISPKYEAHAYNSLGLMANKRMEFEIAVGYFEKSRDISKAGGYTKCAAIAENKRLNTKNRREILIRQVLKII